MADTAYDWGIVMAVYIYACPRCGHEWEHIEDAKTHVVGQGQPCPCCGMQGEWKPTPGTTFRLKGGGWTPNASRAHGKDGNPHGM